MNVLNLYAGIGGNRKRWDELGVQVTAVEYDRGIAEAYNTLYPKDELFIDDAHEFLLNHYNEFDFVWASPPCPSHSKMMKATRHNVVKYPDMKLYEEIIFLQHFFKGKWVVENVNPYYKPLIKPSFEIDRHLFWTNFQILPPKRIPSKPSGFITASNKDSLKRLKNWLDIDYPKNLYAGNNHCPGQVYRNCVHPDIGFHILSESMREGLFEGFYN